MKEVNKMDDPNKKRLTQKEIIELTIKAALALTALITALKS